MAEPRPHRRFDRWERAIAVRLDGWLRDPLLLEPAGHLLALVTKTKSRMDALRDYGFGVLGLATRREQAETQFALRELEHRVRQLAERIDDLRE